MFRCVLIGNIDENTRGCGYTISLLTFYIQNRLKLRIVSKLVKSDERMCCMLAALLEQWFLATERALRWAAERSHERVGAFSAGGGTTTHTEGTLHVC
ncbi:unnamed protein product [Pieris brassicae]|uniref:Uncharacterized protein n=1 Tax=Pieris brassicae TaxID=7116 RepID=A0A9P0T3I5_PIEBR|nr:unnamed protein product [Pieris brassicae]